MPCTVWVCVPVDSGGGDCCRRGRWRRGQRRGRCRARLRGVRRFISPKAKKEKAGYMYLSLPTYFQLSPAGQFHHHIGTPSHMLRHPAPWRDTVIPIQDISLFTENCKKPRCDARNSYQPVGLSYSMSQRLQWLCRGTACVAKTPA